MSKQAEFVAKYKYAYAVWTYKTDFLVDKTLVDEAHLLELRCFDSSGEYYAVRDDLSNDFSEREITDDKRYSDGYYDELQFLDIDQKLSESGNVRTIGGGCYHLPEGISDMTKLNIRVYYKFDKDGVARKYDWRILGFEK